MVVGNHDLVSDVLRDVRGFCEKNTLSQTAAEIANALSALERETSPASSLVLTRRTCEESGDVKLV